MDTPFIACAAITSISAVIGLGCSLVAARDSSGNQRTLAFQSCARSFTLAMISLISIATESSDLLIASALAMVVAQGFDAMIGFTIKSRLKTLGPAFLSVVNFVLLLWYAT